MCSVITNLFGEGDDIEHESDGELHQCAGLSCPVFGGNLGTDRLDSKDVTGNVDRRLLNLLTPFLEYGRCVQFGLEVFSVCFENLTLTMVFPALT